MAGNIKGITIEFNGKTEKLESAMGKINAQGKNLNTELKQINSSLHFNPGNSELIAQKHRVLSETIQQTKDKLDVLKQADKEAKKQLESGNLSKESYDNLRRDIIKTENQLKSFEKQLKQVDSTAKKVGDGLSKAGDKMTSMGKNATVGLTAPIAAAGGYAFKMASDYEESLNKVDTAFDTSSQKVKDFADTTLEGIGIAKGTALEMASLFGDMAVGMDIPRDKAADMSIQLTQLAGDLSSYKNVSAEVAQTALKGVFTGEGEALKGLGVVMTDATLKQYAVESGFINIEKSEEQLREQSVKLEDAQNKLNAAIAKHGEGSIEAQKAQVAYDKALEKSQEPMKVNLDNLTQAEKVQLRYNYVMSKAKDSQGDFAKTQGSSANQLKIFQESLKQLATLFGQSLLPVFTPLIQGLNKILLGISQLPAPVRNVIMVILGLLAAIGPLLVIFGAMASGLGAIISFFAAGGAAATMFGGFISMLSSPITIVILAIAALVAIIYYLYQRWDEIGPALSRIWNTFTTNFANDVQYIKNIFNNEFEFIKNKAFSVFESIRTAISNKINAAKEVVKSAIEAIKGFFNFNFTWPHIPLPHFSVSPQGWQVGDLLKGSIPSLGIKWYDKGGIFSSPAVIGVGEKRPEFVGALDDLRKIVGDVIEQKQPKLAPVVNYNFAGAYFQRGMTDSELRDIMDRMNKVNQKELEGKGWR